MADTYYFKVLATLTGFHNMITGNDNGKQNNSAY